MVQRNRRPIEVNAGMRNYIPTLYETVITIVGFNLNTVLVISINKRGPVTPTTLLATDWKNVFVDLYLPFNCFKL